MELEQAAERSAKRHREFVRDRVEVIYETARVRQVAEQAIRKAVQAKDNPADLINVALEELVRARCELPGYTTLDAMAAAIRTEVNNAFYRWSPGGSTRPRVRLARLLLVDPVTRRSEFDRLKDVAKAASLGKFKAAARTAGRDRRDRADRGVAGGHPAGEDRALRRGGAGHRRRRPAEGAR